MAKQALLVIDVQRGLFDAAPRPGDADAVLARINALARTARAAGAPVIFIQHETVYQELRHGSTAWELERTLDVLSQDHLVRKTTPDAFMRTPLAELLDRAGVKEVVICGYATEFCVDTTTRRAAALGYPVTLVADAHTTHDKPHASADQIRTHHNATLSNIRSFGPRIVAVPAAEVVFSA